MAVSNIEAFLEAFDFGPQISHIKIHDSVAARMVQTHSASVYVRKIGHPKTGVLVASVSAEADEVIMTFANHPSHTDLSPLHFNPATGHLHFDKEIELNVVFSGDDKVKKYEIIATISDYHIQAIQDYLFEEHEGNHGDIIRYAFYRASGIGPRPLLIWLHGAWEGGDDLRIALLGNPTTRLSGDPIQAYFGGAHVLVPQAPTFWMDDGSGHYTKDGRSRYLEDLVDLIQDALRRHSDIDARRIYLGGSSNGGFMTMLLLIRHPEIFAAGFPVCEAYHHQWLTDDDLDVLRRQAIWFTASKDDRVVHVDQFTQATFDRLTELKAKNIHLSLFEHVVDPSNQYLDAEGHPWRYDGHGSWICVLNDQVFQIINKKKQSLFSWLASQKRSTS
ncbi:MAG: prolyl oligopeptidase family serine peptidase [Candidatus Izemoplasmatales bacterium]|jgi:predicted peptidase